MTTARPQRHTQPDSDEAREPASESLSTPTAHGMPRRYVLDPHGRDIAAESRALRLYGPVAPIELPGAVPAWAVTDPELLRAVLTSPDVSKDPHNWPAWREGRIPSDWPLAPWVSMRNLLTAHGSEHRRLRSVVSQAFTARRVEQLRSRIHAASERLLDELPEHAVDDVVDIRAHYALPLPLTIMAELLGLPTELHQVAHECMSVILSPHPGTDPPAAYARLRQTLVDLVAAKRDQPGEDLVSALIAGRDSAAAPLTETELVDTVGAVLGGGFESATNLLDQAITALCTRPTQLALVQTGQVKWDDIVEETLRWRAPLPYMPLRFAVRSCTLGGTVIERGEPILAAYGAIGTDPGTHGPDADGFDATRPSRRRHMSFGHGPHACLGALLARTEATLALRALFARYPGAALAVPTNALEPISLIAHGHRALPITLQTRSGENRA